MDIGINKNCQSLLEDTFVIDVPEDLQPECAELSYLFIDVKIDPERDKMIVCEFGEAKNASPKLNCPIYVNGIMEKNMCAPFCNLFWHYLSQFNIPIWYIGQDPVKNPKGAAVRELFKQRVGWNSLQLIGGHQAPNLTSLKKNPFFIKHATQEKTVIKDTISSYKGIVFYRDRDDIERKRFNEFENFRKEFPDFFTINVSSRPYAAHKTIGNSLFDDEETAVYKPRWKEYAKQYSPDLAQRIFDDLQCDFVVIKPTNSGRSNGILMAGTHNLDKILYKILPHHKTKLLRTINYRPTNPKTYEYWKKDKNKTFIVEEFFHAKPALIRGKLYDPAIRAYAILRYEQGKIYVTVLQGFLKIPPKALTDQGSFLDKHRTGSGFSGRGTDTQRELVRGLPISKEDTLFLREKLKEIFPKVYLKMLQRGPVDFF